MPTKLLIVGELNGRNGADPPLALPDDQAVEMINVDRYDGMIGRKRNGADLVTETGGTAFSLGIQEIGRHVPGADETAAEMWATDGAATPIVKRMTGGTAFANVTLDDAISTRPQDVIGVSLNGKRFMAYDSTQDRLHAYDPLLAAPRVRRVGIAPGTTAPTMANQGGGAWAATKRYYRVRFGQLSGVLVIRKSEATSSGSFTPSGAAASTRVTRPALPGEGETHWYLEASTDDVSYVQSAAVVIATTFIDDLYALTDTTIWTGGTSEASGLYALFPSVKYLISDGNRLIGGGAWESSGATSGGKNSRLWFTPVLGSLDRGDDERAPSQTNQKNWLDLNENDGGGITGLGGPLNGTPYAFKYRQIWKLNPTGDIGAPYLPRKVVDGIGCVSHKSIAMGIDEAGRPALYFLSHTGPYRIGANGLQYLGRDNEDLTMNLGATTVVAHSVYYPLKHQWWLWIATGSSNDPDTLLVFDPLLGKVDQDNRIRNGWFRWNGNLAAARCSALFANTLGASMSRDFKPYIGRATGTVIWKGDSTATNDAGTAFQAYVKTKPLSVAPLGMNVGIGQSYLLAEVGSGITITQTIDRDYGLETRTSTVLLTATGSETRTLQKFEGSDMAQAGTIQIQIGDGSALSNNWVLDALSIPVTTEDRR